MMYVYLQVLQERGKRGGEKRRGKASRVCTRGEKSPSERRGVVRECDRVLARRLAVAVRAAGRALVDGPEHDAADPSAAFVGRRVGRGVSGAATPSVVIAMSAHPTKTSLFS